MSTFIRADQARAVAFRGRELSLAAFWIGFALCAAPTLIANFHESWSSEQGEHAPIVLAIGLWLVARRWGAMRQAGSPGSPMVAALAGFVGGCVYVLGRVAGQFLVETYALYALALTAVYAQVGRRGMVVGWFPLAYLALALPPPYAVSWLLTSHLRLWVTEAAVAVYQAFGLEIVRDGLNILVDQYNLAVKEACSGMNSLVSLSAIGLVYLHLRRAPPWWYYAAMFVPIVLIAIFANFVRILVLIGLTHFFGDAVAQSYLHEGAGLLTFVVALISVIGLDALLGRRLPAGVHEGGVAI